MDTQDTCESPDDQEGNLVIAEEENAKSQTSHDIRTTIEAVVHMTSGELRAKWENEYNKDALLFACTECDFVCEAKMDLLTHTLSHGDSKCFPCPECEYKGASMKLLKSHIKIHSEEMPFACSDCDFKCRSKVTLNKHRLKHLNPECKQSETVLNFSNELNSDIVREDVHIEIPRLFPCSECGFICETEMQLQSHTLSHNDLPDLTNFPCPKCEYKGSSMKLLKCHMKKHLEEMPFKCTDCDFECKSKVTLKKHMLKHVEFKLSEFDGINTNVVDIVKPNENQPISHSDELLFEQKSMCDDILTQYLSEDISNIEEKENIENSIQSKDNCNGELFQNSLSNKNEDSSHIQDNVNENFIDNSQMNIKEDSSHTEDKCIINSLVNLQIQKKGLVQLSCNICDFTCTLKTHLKRHMLSHTNKITFPCPEAECDYISKSRANLNRHKLKHTKPFACSKCNYKCALKAQLDAHLRKHESEERLSANNNDYLTNNDLKYNQHSMILAEEIEFSCSECTFTCSKQAALNKHTISHSEQSRFRCSEWCTASIQCTGCCPLPYIL